MSSNNHLIYDLLNLVQITEQTKGYTPSRVRLGRNQISFLNNPESRCPSGVVRPVKDGSTCLGMIVEVANVSSFFKVLP